MNHASLESAKRWQEKGLFRNSEKIWFQWEGQIDDIEAPNGTRMELYTALRGRPFDEVERPKECDFIPAPNCEEMGAELWANRIRVTRLISTYSTSYEEYHFEEFEEVEGEEEVRLLKEEYITAKTEAEAREKAINWYLDNNKK